MSEQESAGAAIPSVNTPVSNPGPRVQAPVSGMAVTSLVLGLVGLLFSIIPFINVAAFFLGGLAIVFGIISIFLANGIKRRGRGLGIAGTALGVVACTVVIIVNLVVGAAVSEVIDAVNVTVDTSAAGGAAGTPADPLAFGTTVTTENGLEVQVGSPTDFTPSSSAMTESDQVYFWSVDVTVTNTGTETYSGFNSASGYTDSGAVCTEVYDSATFGDSQSMPGDLPPGKTSTQTYAFGCPKTGLPELQYQSGFLGTSLYYSTQAK